MFGIDEQERHSYTALLVRVGRADAIEWGRRFRASGAIEPVRVEQDSEEGRLRALPDG